MLYGAWRSVIECLTGMTSAIKRKDHRGVAAISGALPFIIALIVGSVLVFTVVAAAVIVNPFLRKPK